MAQLMAVHYADWFGVAGAGGQFDPQERWESLSIMPETTCPCDMLMVMPSRLASELNGEGGLFHRALYNVRTLYAALWHGVSGGPSGQLEQDDVGSLDAELCISLVSAVR
jgi:hypothetical protein